MSGYFEKAANTVRGSALVIPIYLIFCALFIIGIGIWIEDYNTSLLGYSLIPTKKYGSYVGYFVAALPQVGQMAFFYMFLEAGGSRKYGIVTALFFLVDNVTDIVYKIAGNAMLIPVAAIETFVIYTLGSEVALTISFGMLVELFPDVLSVLSDWMQAIYKALEDKDGGRSNSKRRQ